MTERRPGPWDSPSEPVATPATPAPGVAPAELDKGQHPAWMALSSLLLVGLVWFLTGSWVVGVCVLFGLLVHEYGHVLAMNRVGMGPARIYVVPFLGGLAKGQRPPVNEWDGVLVSLAGPLFGLLAMIPVIGVWAVTGHGAWLLGAFFIALINLLNLLPAPPLDGSKALGPVLARVHPTLERLALLGIGALAVWWGLSTGRYILAVFLGIAVLGHLRAGAWRSGEGPLSWPQAGRSLALYLAVGILCAAAALGALIPLADGSPQRAVMIGLRFLGLDFAPAGLDGAL